MYNCLPMYHSVGGVHGYRRDARWRRFRRPSRKIFGQPFLEMMSSVGTAHCFNTSASFAATCCTLRRRQTKQPSHSPGLRQRFGPEIWKEFKDRFWIPQIFEFYAAPKVAFRCLISRASWGHRPYPLLPDPSFSPALVGFDIERVNRFAMTWLCIRCATNEAGEAYRQAFGGGSS